MVHQYIFLLLVCYSTVSAGPINLFVNVTMNDRPDLEIIDGDIAFDANAAPEFEPGRNAYIRASKWTGGLLPYVIDGATFTAAHRTTMTNAMRRIESQTNNCIRFVQRTNQPTWIRIHAGTG